MKPELLEDLICPACGGRLKLRPAEVAEEHVITGWLDCAACPEQYPVIQGIPRMLLGVLRAALEKEYPGFFRDQRVGEQEPASEEQQQTLKVMRSFGYEWRYFSDIQPEGEANFRWYFEAFPAESLAGKSMLDVGCGKGRHLFYAARHARKVIGIDLSGAVDAAFANTRHLPNAHIVQANLFQLPLRTGSFDFLYSLGVLDHLPRPEVGLREMLRYGRPGADVLFYVYWSLNDEARWKRYLLRGVNTLRVMTTRMPFPLLRGLCWCAAVGGEVAFVLPYKALKKAKLDRFAETLPLKTYARFPFRVLYQDQFDRFSSPIENRYDREEVAGWLQRAGLTDQQILRGAGWRAMGRIPAAASAAGTGAS